jgi:isoleucyl-tRNA synthetase
VGDHVTLESGTGCVHTAPGHGVEDFEVCTRYYPDIDIIVPVDGDGRMTAEAGPFEGLTTEQANRAIADHLKETGHLFASNHILHQYPHCWRCKKPVLFRATEQWFCSVEQFKAETVQAIKEVEWIPGWGEERMIAMVTDRSDWCISRQRLWGVPIPIFTCKQCGKPHIDDASIRAVSALFRQKGSDAWFETAAADILPAGTVCKFCGGTEFDKETDIMDVWFDSGVSHAAVLDQRPDSRWPADLYLEGHDQYRGWFQSSLLTSVAWRGKAPYRQVCTHGWVVDGEGRKMSKSLGNGIDPSEIVGEYGADILRLWVASSDYHTDIRISRDILKQLSEVYRKIRNTARYILGNLYDFDPAKDSVPDDRLTELDRWALAQLDLLIRKVREAYGSFDFHIIYHAVHNFCTVDMSNFYLDVIKDRLYVEAPDSEARRAAQTAIYRILRALTTMLAPILPYTAEEIWAFLPAQPGMEPQSVMYNQMPGPAPKATDAVFLAKWDRIHMIRDDVNKALETARVQKEIGKSLEAKVILTAEGELYEFLEGMLNELTTLFIVSAVELQKGSPDKETPGPDIRVARADGGKCERCWMHSETVGQDPGHPTLCRRCAKIVG